jgi:Trypsin-like peptidase domain
MDFRHLVDDDDLRAELLDRVATRTLMTEPSPGGGLEGFEGGSGSFRGVRPADLVDGVHRMNEGVWAEHRDGELEAIILRFTRPVFFVSGAGFVSPSDGWADSAVLGERLQAAAVQIAAAVPSVGRIDLTNHMYDWVGTGWLVAPETVVTNRHVAQIFADRAPGGGFEFRASEGNRRVRARVDLRREHGSGAECAVRVREVLWIEPDGGPDVALLRVDAEDEDGRPLPSPIPLMAQEEIDVSLGSWVVVIGYPARSPYNNLTDQQRIFDGVYDVKRLAPGTVMEIDSGSGRIAHDATTLGGNSGSVVMELASGKAVGLHYGGIEGDRNRAVQATVVQDRLAAHG